MHWIAVVLLGATLFTVATVAVVCMAAGWVLGYQHHALISWGRDDPLRPVTRAYRELWRDIVHLAVTGELRTGR